jgi:hypothetical protein
MRRRWIPWIAALALLGGCGSASTGPGDGGRLRQQARDALDRYDRAVQDAGGQQRFVPVGHLTGQVGDWEPANGDHKEALLAGRVAAVAPLPAAPQPTAPVVWDSGTTETFTIVPAGEALAQIITDGAGDCPTCRTLEVTDARLSTIRVQTTRGPATAPAWEYTLRGTGVRVTRVAVAPSTTVRVTPASWDPFNAPGGLAIESASTTLTGKRLTVTFTGSPGPRSQPCGADYTAEAVESANAVVVIVTAHPHAADGTCTAIGAPRTADVELAQPLGERAVLEVQQGLPVRLTITP